MRDLDHLLCPPTAGGIQVHRGRLCAQLAQGYPMLSWCDLIFADGLI